MARLFFPKIFPHILVFSNIFFNKLIYGYNQRSKDAELGREIIIANNNCCDSGYTLEFDFAVKSYECVPSSNRSLITTTYKSSFNSIECAGIEVENHYVEVKNSTILGNLVGNVTLVSAEGYLTFDGIKYHPPNSFCFDRLNESTALIQLCPRQCTKTSPCLKKCCPLGRVIAKDKNRCVEGGKYSKWPPFLQHHNASVVLLNSPTEHCESSNIAYLLNSNNASGSDVKFKVLNNGAVVFKTSPNSWEEVEENEFFCIDDVEPDDSTSFPGSILIYCAREDPISVFVFSVVYGTVMFLASIFLLLAAIVNFLLWKKQNIHTWTLQAYILSLFSMYVLLGLSHVFSALGYNGYYCAIIGGAAHYCFLSTFCWLSMINFDLWWKFRKLQSGSSHGKRLLFYAGFSIFTPLLIIAVGILIDQLSGSELESFPGLSYGVTLCFMESGALWPYFYGPISIILGINLLFFFSTLHTLYVIGKNTRIATETVRHSRHCKQVTLFLKLFCIMGILWNFELISFIFEDKNHRDQQLWYWSVLDFLTIFQAIAIFFIFTWKRKIRKDLEDEYPRLKGIMAKFHCCSTCCRPLTSSSENVTSAGRKGSSNSTGTSLDYTQTTPSRADEVCMSSLEVR